MMMVQNIPFIQYFPLHDFKMRKKNAVKSNHLLLLIDFNFPDTEFNEHESISNFKP